MNYAEDTTLIERLQALANHDAGDWGDVERRAARAVSRRRARRLRLALAVCGLAAVALAGSAFGVYRPIVSFFESDPAPEEIRKQFSILDVGAPPGMATGVVAGEARRLSFLDVRGREHELSIAPTNQGGYCAQWGDGTGGCDRLGTVPLNVFWSGTRHGPPSERGRPPGEIDAVYGSANAKYVDSVEIELDDGTIVRPPLTWVSEPIDQRFFFHRLPAEQVQAGRSIAAVVGRSDGDVVVTDGLGRAGQVPVSPHPDAIVEEREAAATLATPYGTAVIWSAPTHYDGRCAWVEYRERSAQVRPCLPKGYEREGSSVGFVPTKDDVLIVGSFRRAADSVDVRYADGEQDDVRLRDGLLLHRIGESHLRRGTHATELVVRDAGGSVLVRFPLPPPGAYAKADARQRCFAPAPLQTEEAVAACRPRT